MAFISLDAENLGDGVEEDSFLHDFGDNKLGNYLKSRYNWHNLTAYEDDDDEIIIDEKFDVLKQYIPISVLEYLLNEDV